MQAIFHYLSPIFLGLKRRDGFGVVVEELEDKVLTHALSLFFNSLDRLLSAPNSQKAVSELFFFGKFLT